MAIKSSISLTDQQDAFARALVREGRYSSLSAVLQQGLDLLRQKTHAEEADVAALRILIDRRSNGSFVTATEMRSQITDMVGRERRERGLEN